MSVKGIWQSGIPREADDDFYQEGYLSSTPYAPSGDVHSFHLNDASFVARTPGPMAACLSACHSLAHIGGDLEVVGDPLDRVIFASTNWVRSCFLV